MWRSFLLIISLTAAAALTEGCSKAKFSESSSSTANSPTADGHSCATALQQLTVPIKVLFVVDTSGSNADDQFYYGTDNNKSLRGGSIQQFFNAYGSHTNYSWGFITFAGSTARSLIGGNPDWAVFTNSGPVMQASINAFYNVLDDDLTPYQAALGMSAQAINADTAAAANTKYIVVFMSDGMPDPDVSDTILKASVQAINNLHPGRVSFNTIYYGVDDPEASARLSMMAATGGGRFLDVSQTGHGSSFDISDLVTVPGVVCK